MGRRHRHIALSLEKTLLGLPPFFVAPEASAQTADQLAVLQGLRESHDIIGLSLVIGLVLFSTITALLHLAGRQSWTKRENALSLELANIRAKLDRAEVFLAAEPQIIIAWDTANGGPEITGDLSLVTDAPVARRVLGFGSWLPPESAQKLDSLVDKLRLRGEAFRLAVESLGGRHLEIEGRAVTGRAVMRIHDVSGDRREVIRLRECQIRTVIEIDALHAMLDAIPNPAWIRDQDGSLTWVNVPFVKAVEAKDPGDAILRQAELLEWRARDGAAAARRAGRLWHERAPAVVAGERRMFDIVEVPGEFASAGMAIDLSDLEASRADLSRLTEAHARTLDQLTTAVAIFDRSQRLIFHNAAYRTLWALDQNFLDQKPTDSQILDRLRAAGLLPEQADFRSWKKSFLGSYQSIETSEQVWYLPDSRTLRIVVNPNPQGGVTYLFDDVTERFHLESQFNALTRVQGETLDTLKEGVAVFGTDGRLKLFNPAFAQLWNLDPKILAERPHIDQVAALCAVLHPDETAWNELRSFVAGLQDERTGFERRFARRDGTVLDCAALPLPDGATLLAFTDMTAGVNVELALTERNQALIDAEKLRNDFVHHVSYELRSPLTTIIGFIQLLGDGAIGPLNDKQREYIGYVMNSSAALLAIINDILDLASIDMDAMELQLEEVDIKETMKAAAQGIQDRVADSDIHLRIIALDDIGSFRADAKRVRQILFNLLSNAIGFSARGQSVTLAALRRDDEIVFKVSDQGRGIPPAVLDRVFNRFHSDTSGSGHRGVGLGLSIVRSLVELHGGRVLIDSVLGEGTTVTCIFPAQGVKLIEARANAWPEPDSPRQERRTQG
ncbi:sensor histidine kinase [Methyloferula stellata]|uniref:sensor histidine kinase n=1 Tax=Methyloferula stellata TaxID=876270 RepID=UPI000367C124|nr:PAS domain-containing sensor histidine kinase [Methyloferula stellata]